MSLKRSSSLRLEKTKALPVIKTSNESNTLENPARFLRNKFKQHIETKENNNDIKIKDNEDQDLKVDQNVSSLSLNLSLSDCTCPICLEVLIEPVKMPCSHELCLPCFKSMTDQTNFLCPMCRMRISSWSRNASNTNSLVDTARWEQIKKSFPVEIKNRTEGKTAILLEKAIKLQKESVITDKNLKICSQPGEIRKEYQDYLRREEERLKLEKANEEKLSLDFIQQLIREEENLSLNDYINTLNSMKEEARYTRTSIISDSINNTTNACAATSAHENKNDSLFDQLNKNLFRGKTETAIQSEQQETNSKNLRNASQITRSNSMMVSSKLLAKRPIINSNQNHSNSTISTSTASNILPASSSSSDDTSIAMTIKLNPRNSFKRSREDVQSLLNKLKSNRQKQSTSINLSNNISTRDASMYDDEAGNNHVEPKEIHTDNSKKSRAENATLLSGESSFSSNSTTTDDSYSSSSKAPRTLRKR